MKILITTTTAIASPLVEHEKEWWELDDYIEHIQATNSRLGEQWATNVRANVDALIRANEGMEDSCE